MAGGDARTLVVMRHAKAEQVAASDTERELADRGHADARETGAWLAGLDVDPDHALVSAAVRTRQTWADVAAAAGWTLEAHHDRGLYAADVDSALDLLRLTPDDARTLVVVGHNPTMAYLAQLLDDGEGDPAVATDMLQGFPTGAAAVFDVEGRWADLAPGGARLVGYHVGRA